MKILITLLALLFAVSAQAATLTWTDNSDNEDGFVIEKLGTDGWSVVGGVATDVTTFSDTSTGEACYRVKAVRTVDGNIESSDYATGCKLAAPSTVTVQ